MRLVCVLFTIENNTGHTDGRTDRRTDTTSYRDATAHLKTWKEVRNKHSSLLSSLAIGYPNFLCLGVSILGCFHKRDTVWGPLSECFDGVIRTRFLFINIRPKNAPFSGSYRFFFLPRRDPMLQGRSRRWKRTSQEGAASSVLKVWGGLPLIISIWCDGSNRLGKWLVVKQGRSPKVACVHWHKHNNDNNSNNRLTTTTTDSPQQQLTHHNNNNNNNCLTTTTDSLDELAHTNTNTTQKQLSIDLFAHWRPCTFASLHFCILALLNPCTFAPTNKHSDRKSNVCTKGNKLTYRPTNQYHCL